ncbi:MAG TPA: NUDIX pyrophosphatase [Bacteroidota bacterium]|nr:NUDIX pyrophosphatase [Bacteroidota bacterium]
MAIVTATLVEVCIFSRKRRRVRYLLLRRSKDEKIYPNLWQFVTGSIEKGEKAWQAAVREFSEETGLKPKSLSVVPYVNSFYDPGWDSVNLMPFFAAEVEGDRDPVLSDEHESFAWLPYERAVSRLVWPGQIRGLEIVHRFISLGKNSEHIRRVF